MSSPLQKLIDNTRLIGDPVKRRAKLLGISGMITNEIINHTRFQKQFEDQPGDIDPKDVEQSKRLVIKLRDYSTQVEELLENDYKDAENV